MGSSFVFPKSWKQSIILPVDCYVSLYWEPGYPENMPNSNPPRRFRAGETLTPFPYTWEDTGLRFVDLTSKMYFSITQADQDPYIVRWA